MAGCFLGGSKKQRRGYRFGFHPLVETRNKICCNGAAVCVCTLFLFLFLFLFLLLLLLPLSLLLLWLPETDSETDHTNNYNARQLRRHNSHLGAISSHYEGRGGTLTSMLRKKDERHVLPKKHNAFNVFVRVQSAHGQKRVNIAFDTWGAWAGSKRWLVVRDMPPKLHLHFAVFASFSAAFPTAATTRSQPPRRRQQQQQNHTSCNNQRP